MKIIFSTIVTSTDLNSFVLSRNDGTFVTKRIWYKIVDILIISQTFKVHRISDSLVMWSQRKCNSPIDSARS
jgi:hypothetical protein